MAFNFLTLVNEINHKMNETPLTSATFADAAGFYSAAKDAVNQAINTINRVGWEWPFNHVTKQLVLTVDQVRYPYEADTKVIDFNSFRIKGESSLNNRTQRLWVMDYERYLDQYSDMEYNPTRYHKSPDTVVRTPQLEFAVFPPPDKAYTLLYEYYIIPAPLENWDDVPTIPEFYKYVINNGSFAEAFGFRGDLEMRDHYLRRFDEGIKDLKNIFVNRSEYVSSTMSGRT